MTQLELLEQLAIATKELMARVHEDQEILEWILANKDKSPCAFLEVAEYIQERSESTITQLTNLISSQQFKIDQLKADLVKEVHELGKKIDNL